MLDFTIIEKAHKRSITRKNTTVSIQRPSYQQLADLKILDTLRLLIDEFQITEVVTHADRDWYPLSDMAKSLRAQLEGDVLIKDPHIITTRRLIYFLERVNILTQKDKQLKYIKTSGIVKKCIHLPYALFDEAFPIL